ncbi:DUF1801 domain-containing protein [Paucibacter soli]|uniref:DUF1801 domain-containing protein n=1 Tax=Paucibacter soli TaxID=3133433 RepID=UPI0030AD71BB
MSTLALESQIAGFLARYTPSIEAQLRDARARLRAMFPRGFELVYDNYNALVFAISPSERTPDAFLSVTAYPSWVTLFFLHGASLHDPSGLLDGKGKQVRGLRLKQPATLNTPEVEALIAQAVAPYESAFSAAPALTTIVKAVSAKQRSRRPNSATAGSGMPRSSKGAAGLK